MKKVFLFAILGGNPCLVFNTKKDSPSYRDENGQTGEAYLKKLVEDKVLSKEDTANFATICLKHSDRINGTDLAKLFKTIQESSATGVIVIQGKNTARHTAAILQATMPKDFTKQIVVVSSDTPASMKPTSTEAIANHTPNMTQRNIQASVDHIRTFDDDAPGQIWLCTDEDATVSEYEYRVEDTVEVDDIADRRHH